MQLSIVIRNQNNWAQTEILITKGTTQQATINWSFNLVHAHASITCFSWPNAQGLVYTSHSPQFHGLAHTTRVCSRLALGLAEGARSSKLTHSGQEMISNVWRPRISTWWAPFGISLAYDFTLFKFTTWNYKSLFVRYRIIRIIHAGKPAELLKLLSRSPVVSLL